MRAGAVGVVSLMLGCSTVTPLQTASVVTHGGTRLGGQVALSPYCSVSLSPLSRCVMVPDGIPTPELRASARRGFAARMDAGLTLHAGAVVPRGVAPGALFDVKRELWTRPSTDGRRHLVSASLGLGGRGEVVTSGTVPRVAPELTGVVAGWYGFETKRWELVASPRFVERVGFIRRTSGESEAIHTEWLGLSLAAITRGTVRFAVGVDYLAPLSDLASGPFTVSIGVLWDHTVPQKE